MDKEQHYEKIEDYLSGNLPGEEAAAFNKKMAADPELAAEVALHRGLAEAIDEEEEFADLEQKISAVFKKERTEAARSREVVRRPLFTPIVWRIAASIALLILATLAAYYYVGQPSDSLESLVAENIAYPASIYDKSGLRSGQQPAEPSSDWAARLDSLWEAADRAYQRGAYSTALGILEKAEALEIQGFQQARSRFHFYIGILQARTGDYEEALLSFEKVTTSYTEEAEWKKALILLSMEGRREEAQAVLQQISTSNTPRQKDALNLLERLRAMD